MNQGLFGFPSALGQGGAAGLTLGAVIPMTSGVAKDVLSIPSGTKLILATFNGVSTNGSSAIAVQLGSRGVPQTSGYGGRDSRLSGGSVVTGALSNCFSLYDAAAAVGYSGQMTFALHDAANNIWTAWGQVNDESSNIHTCTGRVTLSGALDMMRFTTKVGTDVFDAGSISFMYM
ncbi:MAG: hypothetical protein NBV67_00430 [Tagaea sp.]|nr:hypothetical protein [Tagaea sp.]